MTDLLSIGRSGVLAYQNALSAVGENVTNAETSGYARRQIKLAEVTAGRTSPYSRPSANFSGVMTVGVTRAWDDYKAAETRIDASDFGRADTRQRWLGTVETALDDSAAGVGQQMTAVFNAADALAADPTSAAPRRQFLLAIDGAAGAMRTTAKSLSNASDGIYSEAVSAAQSINDSLASLAKVDRELHRAQPGSTAAADAADERDRLIDEIASKINVTVTLDDHGAASLTVGDSTGQVLLDGVNAQQIGISRAADGRISYKVTTPAGGQAALTPTGGALAGLSDLSNIVADRQQTLDGIATDFAGTLNGWSAAGLDRNGAAGVDLVDLGSGGAATITAVAIDPDGVAAATATSPNGNALALGQVRGDGGLEQRWSAMVSANAQTTAAAKSEATASSARKDASFAARDGVSGIDLDNEAADLIRYQQAYSASAKIIQTAREALQDILGLFS